MPIPRPRFARIFCAVAIVGGVAACKSEKDDFAKMKPEIDPIVATFTPLAADFERAKKESAPPSSNDPLRVACGAAQKAAADTHFDVLMFRADQAKATAIAFQDGLAALTALTLPDVGGDLVLVLRWDSTACEKAFAKLCAASTALSAAAKANGVAIEPICR